jgi:3-hydroxyisobutyrate dehydrogenase
MKIGFAGIGRMGEPMTLRLLGAGFSVMVWNRTRERLPRVIAAGAIAAESLSALAEQSDAVLTMVTDDAAVEQVYIGPGGLFATDVSGKIFCDLSTVLPETIRRIAGEAQQQRASFVDAPVAGTVQPATTQKLGAAEMLFDVQFSPGVETARDLVARMEELWQVAKQA